VQVTPITHYVSDNILEHRQQIAVNQNYISYALKQGQLRILHKHSTARALAKGHLPLTGITDLRYALSSAQGSTLLTAATHWHTNTICDVFEAVVWPVPGSSVIPATSWQALGKMVK
jgi:hypothetical protein